MLKNIDGLADISKDIILALQKLYQVESDKLEQFAEWGLSCEGWLTCEIMYYISNKYYRWMTPRYNKETQFRADISFSETAKNYNDYEKMSFIEIKIHNNRTDNSYLFKFEEDLISLLNVKNGMPHYFLFISFNTSKKIAKAKKFHNDVKEYIHKLNKKMVFNNKSMSIVYENLPKEGYSFSVLLCETNFEG